MESLPNLVFTALKIQESGQISRSPVFLYPVRQYPAG